MKPERSSTDLILGQGLVAFCASLFLASFVFAAGGGTVTGTIHVMKASVETTGPRSDKEVVVYLEPVDKTAFPTPVEKPKMDQTKLNFVPHVLAVQTGTTVDFLNNDAVNHNVTSPAACCPFDLGQWGKGVVKHHTFDRAGVAPLLCSLHPEMAAFVVVVDTPYFTTAEISPAQDGKKQTARFTIKGVPPGQYKLKVWNSKLVGVERTLTVTKTTRTQTDVDLRKK